MLLACRSVRAAAAWLGLSWDQLQAIMGRAVERGLKRRELEGLRHAGMDEKSFAKGQSDVSLLNDLDRGRVLEVEPGNERAAADPLLAALPPQTRAALAAVCIDMSGHFAAAARAGLPATALVQARFHISAHRNDGVAAGPREENRRLQKLGDERLKGTQRLFGFDPDTLDEEQAVKFAQLKGSDLKTARTARPPASLPSPFRLLAGRSRKCSGASGITVMKAARGSSSKSGLAGRAAADSSRWSKWRRCCSGTLRTSSLTCAIPLPTR